MLSRDVDSNISEREVAAVKQWLNSDASFHVMRDHPQHGVFILAGRPTWSNMFVYAININVILKSRDVGS